MEVSISGVLVADASSVSAMLLEGVSSPLKPRGVAPGIGPFPTVVSPRVGVLSLLFRAAHACLLRVCGPGVMTSRSLVPASVIQAGSFESSAVKYSCWVLLTSRPGK